MSNQKTGNATIAGIACGAGAGAFWGLVFLAPELAGDFTPLQLTAGRYLFYGALSLLLLLPRWRQLGPHVTRREWLALGWLAFTGNTLYFILLSSAVQNGGVALTALVVGFLPVAVTIIGSRDHGAVPLRRLVPSLLLCMAGAICIGWQAVVDPSSGTVEQQLIGLGCAVGALISWTGFAVGNSRWLARLDHVSPHDWNLLTGLVTGAQSLLLLPFALLLDTAHHTDAAWLRLGAISLGVAVLASILGNALWNRMSRLLPLTLAGQMILFETLFALVYAFVWERRLPTPMEAAAFALLVPSVISCIAAHRKPGTVPVSDGDTLHP
ncbi:DMT family transporter [Novosphingobium aerophilum]|uniref:DMT family transporter n=1 Tax=Novosphingobium TaxID=165696 RepID=UPI0006C833BC|nr:DMT family transporter [Novosphingobium sp. ST904]KPH58173.1 multidrug DMT transporter permease [Novosphingobium sp. ST904]TCM41323.1 drug/metabolite transporter (DMT)-like permease [Novosphingobium sp. ST904]